MTNIFLYIFYFNTKFIWGFLVLTYFKRKTNKKVLCIKFFTWLYTDLWVKFNSRDLISSQSGNIERSSIIEFIFLCNSRSYSVDELFRLFWLKNFYSKSKYYRFTSKFNLIIILKYIKYNLESMAILSMNWNEVIELFKRDVMKQFYLL
jgi:hypothetical protein